jgi:hypothetical protein
MKRERVYVVETKSGKGYTKHSDKPENGKIPVYLESGRKILCSPENVKIIGFKD